jgi:hypothetical protein
LRDFNVTVRVHHGLEWPSAAGAEEEHFAEEDEPQEAGEQSEKEDQRGGWAKRYLEVNLKKITVRVLLLFRASFIMCADSPQLDFSIFVTNPNYLWRIVAAIEVRDRFPGNQHEPAVICSISCFLEFMVWQDFEMIDRPLDGRRPRRCIFYDDTRPRAVGSSMMSIEWDNICSRDQAAGAAPDHSDPCLTNYLEISRAPA